MWARIQKNHTAWLEASLRGLYILNLIVSTLARGLPCTPREQPQSYTFSRHLLRDTMWLGSFNGQTSYIPPTILGVPNAQRGDKIRNGYLTSVVSTAHMWAKWLHHPCHIRAPQRLAREQNQKWQPNPSGLRGPQVGKEATSPLPSRGYPQGQSQNRLPIPCHLKGRHVDK